MAQSAPKPLFPKVNRQSSVTRAICLIPVNSWRLEPASSRSADATQTRHGETKPPARQRRAAPPGATFSATAQAAQAPDLAVRAHALARLGRDLRRGVLVAFPLRSSRHDKAPGEGRVARCDRAGRARTADRAARPDAGR